MSKQNASTQKKPNILVIFGDDIGIPQISAYAQGLMGYRTTPMQSPTARRSQKPASFNLDSVEEQVVKAVAGKAGS